MEALHRLNDAAEVIDAREVRERQRRAAAAVDLRGRCAPYKAVLALDQVPAPAPVAGVSEVACAILGLVAHFVAGGAAGLQVGAHDLAWLYHVSLRTVWRALGELRDGGWLIVTPDYVPAEQTALGGPYLTGPARAGRPRSLRTDAPEAYVNSRVRNLYTLGTPARFAQLGARCGQVAEITSGTATCSALFPDSGSPGSFGFSARPCEVVDNSRSSSPPSSPEIELLSRDSQPLVADACGGETTAGGGDDGGHDGKSRGRGLFASLGWRLRRFLDGGEA